MLCAHSKAHVDCVSRVLRNAEHLPQLPVSDLILDSWRRSMEQHHLDPGSLQGPRILSQNVLQECRERSELFLRIASEGRAPRFGRSRFGGSHFGTWSAQFMWTLNTGPRRRLGRRFGGSYWGERFGVNPSGALECVIRRSAPAHALEFINYG